MVILDDDTGGILLKRDASTVSTVSARLFFSDRVTTLNNGDYTCTDSALNLPTGSFRQFRTVSVTILGMYTQGFI